ncbi:MAG: prenyltransferase [Candidatus Omnitrophica bacterium]|nr:prenyltransferase [Candidatus Omnitrophota bacterium]
MMKNLIRALRLPFITASVLPFVFGSLINRSHFQVAGFLLGFIAAAATHLGSNLINDYADSKSGADWQDKKFYGLFGGSKLIQENVLSEKFYLNSAIVCAIIASTAVLGLAFLLKSSAVVIYYLIIIILGWSYSTKPLQFSYHKLGEIIIFLLFGPAVVMGGYFIQTGVFPDMKSFVLSLPFGFFTTAILYANEIPDFYNDQKAHKFNWVSILGVDRAYILYLVLMFSGVASVALAFRLGFLKMFSLGGVVILTVPIVKAALIMKKSPADKDQLVKSSQMTIAVQTVASIILIFGTFL